MTGALVLGGGGLAGIAWEVGVLLGIEQEAPDVAASLLAPTTTFIGTSAGAVVASQVAGGLPVRELFDLQLLDDPEVGVTFDVAELTQVAQIALNGVTSVEEAKNRLTELARSRFGDVDRSAVIAARLPLKDWPEAPLRITAVDELSGDLRVFDAASGAPLVDVVAASCAVPIIWPAVEIQGRAYIDGGVRSSTHADLAAGCDPVLVIAPNASAPPAETLGLGRVLSIRADAASIAAFGPNPLDPAVWRASAEAGLAQGRRKAAAVKDFWTVT